MQHHVLLHDLTFKQSCSYYVKTLSAENCQLSDVTVRVSLFCMNLWWSFLPLAR